MIHLVTGGSGSGKSEYAENWLTGRNKKDGTYIYIATMQPYTEETMKKIERHHRLRAGKGFRTLEKYTDLSELEIPKNQESFWSAYRIWWPMSFTEKMVH